MANQSFIGKVAVHAENQKKHIYLDGDSSAIRVDSVSAHTQVQIMNSRGRVVADDESIKIQKADPEVEGYNTTLEIEGDKIKADNIEPLNDDKVNFKNCIRIIDEDKGLETVISPKICYSKPTYTPARPTGEYKLEFDYKKIDGVWSDVYVLHVDEIYVDRINPVSGGANFFDTIADMKTKIKDLQDQIDELKSQLPSTP